MTYDVREYARLRNSVLAVSITAWIILLRPSPAISSCCGGDCVTPLQMVVASNPHISLLLDMVFASGLPSSLAGDWVLMLLAMMTLTLVQPIYHIRISSFVKRRTRSTAFFVVGYGGVWIGAGSLLLTLTLVAKVLIPSSYLPAIVAGLAALVWQVSPIKQRCLNRCHNHRPLAAFGKEADRDALRMGLEHGRWCVGSCWATMLFPMLLPHGHFVAMVAVSILMFSERLDAPRKPVWGWRGFETAFRYVNLRIRRLRYGLASTELYTKA